MKIGARLQIFEGDVFVTDKDRERLTPHLSGWNHLHEVFLLGINVPDLKRLVVLEMLGQQRQAIIDRLLARISKLEKQIRKEKVKRCLLSSKAL